MSKLFAVMALLAVPGCACWTPEHAQEPKCVVTHQIVDCTEGSISSVLLGLTPLLADLISGQSQMDQSQFDSVMQERLKVLGFKDGGCILAALEHDFMARTQVSAPLAMKVSSVHTALSRWKAAHNASDVRFKLKTPNGETVYR